MLFLPSSRQRGLTVRSYPQASSQRVVVVLNPVELGLTVSIANSVSVGGRRANQTLLLHWAHVPNRLSDRRNPLLELGVPSEPPGPRYRPIERRSGGADLEVPVDAGGRSLANRRASHSNRAATLASRVSVRFPLPALPQYGFRRPLTDSWPQAVELDGNIVQSIALRPDDHRLGTPSTQTSTGRGSADTPVPTLQDAPALAQALRDPKVARSFPLPAGYTLGDTRAFVRSCRTRLGEDST
jgi:hypothetical protein